MKKMTLAIALEMITALQNRIEELEKSSMTKVKSRKCQIKSTRDMTIEDAERIILGDMKKLSHKEAAKELGLSYGQIYSARGGYTFKEITDKKLKLQKK